MRVFYIHAYVHALTHMHEHGHRHGHLHGHRHGFEQVQWHVDTDDRHGYGLKLLDEDGHRHEREQQA
jgi:hypothetical protein